MEKEKKKFGKLKILFIILFMAASIVPLVLMPVFGNQEAESSESDVALTPLVVDGKINKAFFTDEYGKFDPDFAESAGDWFSKKFALRREMVDIGDRIKAEVFGISGQDGVVVGREGYLFYKDSFDNFLGRSQLTDYELWSAADTLRMMQDAVTETGASFIFTVAPNKNSLYPELMPERYDPDIDMRNISRLTPLMEERGVRYFDLYRLFKEKRSGEVMYLKGDSHWNNDGARMVTKALQEKLGKKYSGHGDELDGGKNITRNDFNGDLYKMLYPASDMTDEQIYFSDMEAEELSKRISVKIPDPSKMGSLSETDIKDEPEWSHSEEIETEHKGDKKGKLLMLRDSFGNSLAPLFADEYKEATFLNNTPYDIERGITEGADTFIFELVERNLDRLLFDAPLVSTKASEAERRKYTGGKFLKKTVDHAYKGSVSAEVSDRLPGYIHVTAKLDPSKAGEKDRYHLMLRDNDTGKTHIFGLFRTRRPDTEDPDNMYGASCYISEEDLPDGSYELSLIYGDDVRTGQLGSFDYTSGF